jgi:stage II sporulation protein D
VAIPRSSGNIVIEPFGEARKSVFWKITIKQKDQDEVKYINQKHLMISGFSLHKGGFELPSKLLFSFSNRSKKTFDVIGLMPLNSYLAGVVSSEMPLSWPKEALKAQVVAARSYALSVMNENKNSPFQLENSTADQVFNHLNNQVADRETMSKVISAIEETENLVLLGKKGKVLNAFYHSDCGGSTTPSSSVWGSPELEVGVADETCGTRPGSRWSYAIKAEKLNEMVRSYFKFPEELFRISQIEFIRPSDSDRVSDIVFHSKGRKVKMMAHQFRQILGFSELKSTNFQVETQDDAWVFLGKGYGHGVGLCQWGTKALAQQGLQFKKILTHYYPHSALAELKQMR